MTSAFSAAREIFSGVTLTDIDEFTLADGASSTTNAGSKRISSNTDLGLTEIEDFTSGSGSTTSDVLDYKSGLVSGDGTVQYRRSSNHTLTNR